MELLIFALGVVCGSAITLTLVSFTRASSRPAPQPRSIAQLRWKL